MIRYAVTEGQLWGRIQQVQATWRVRAEARTTLFRQAGRYYEPPAPFWSEIKAVYMRLQKNKCAFCERKLTVRNKDHDVEHFRPKRGVEAWPPPGGMTYPFPTGAPFPEGYYLLAYHPFNYATTCEHCNRGLKRSYFPIKGQRISGKDDPSDLKDELPLLIYPIGNLDSDPETLIEFEGIIPRPTNTDPAAHNNHRARVTIDFFDLQGREELRRERAAVITLLFLALKNEASSDSDVRNVARRTIYQKTQQSSEHANCARCFVVLYRRNPVRATLIARKAEPLARRTLTS